jgi:intermediate peptidase
MLANSLSNVLKSVTRRPHNLLGSVPGSRLNTTKRQFRVSAHASPATADDLDLAAVFDQPSTSIHTSSIPSGLFGEHALTTPQSFHALAVANVRKAQAITQRVLDAPRSREEMFKVVKNLDRLSDTLCSVIDLAELVRNSHPDATWVKMADDIYDQLCEYMNTLNVSVELYEVRVYNNETSIHSLMLVLQFRFSVTSLPTRKSLPLCRRRHCRLHSFFGEISRNMASTFPKSNEIT